MVRVHDFERGRTTSWERKDGGREAEEKRDVRRVERCWARSGRSVVSAVGALHKLSQVSLHPHVRPLRAQGASSSPFDGDDDFSRSGALVLVPKLDVLYLALHARPHFCVAPCTPDDDLGTPERAVRDVRFEDHVSVRERLAGVGAKGNGNSIGRD